MVRKFRNTEYTIHVCRTGTPGMCVDGQMVEGNVVPLTDKKQVAVEVTL